MDIELLVVPECPNERTAYDLVSATLAELRISAPVTRTVIADEEDARARGFTGSPTVLVDGEDPFALAGAPVAVACRVYRTPEGLAGVPPREQLREALRSAALSDERGDNSSWT